MDEILAKRDWIERLRQQLLASDDPDQREEICEQIKQAEDELAEMEG